jgi:pimeloyl-ACP methyl ester carboxylesterase
MAAISETGFVTLGGIPQWVEVRGADIANPVLIALHGGPGTPETPLLRHYNSAMETAFTIVYWDQRGAGRSFSRAIPAGTMTIDRFVADLDALVDHVCARLGTRRVAIFGHSWGSMLGTLYAARYPDKVSAYIGTGQIGDLAASERASYAFVLEEAKRRDNAKAVAELTKLGPPPYSDNRKLGLQRRWLGRFVGMFGRVPFWRALRIVLLAPGTSLFNIPNVFRGIFFSLRMLWPQISAINLETAAPELKMPVWFLSGRHDHQVDAAVAEAYFNKLKAPRKQLVWFENSGHFVPFEEPEKFNETMAEIATSLR